MIKRLVLAFIFIIVSLTAISLVYLVVFASDETQEQPMAKPKVEHWNGKATKYIGSSFVGQRNKLDIIGYEFTGLNSKKANVTIILNTRSVGGKIPSWVKVKRGFTGNIGGKKVYPTIKWAPFRGNLYKIQLSFKSIPIKALGITCKQETPTQYGTPQYPLYVNFNSFSRNPRKVLSNAVLAPSPPHHHCLGKGGKPKPKPKVKIQQIKVTGKNNRKRIWVIGRATSIKRVRVTLGSNTVSFPAVRKKRFKVSFRAPRVKGKKTTFTVRAGSNARPGLSVKKVTVRRK